MILGTAGHVDHGKTALVKALTGVDTDRLAEEKRRGITIELGFAPLHLDGGITLGVVDVPGHEAFVRTMLAGATGVDLALLVVAADEGVMPQTREHLSILTLLGTRGGVVALTKSDLVDEEWMSLVRDDVRTALAGTPLAAAPLVPTSVVTGAGLDALRAALAAATAALPARAANDLFRMPVDRVFSVRGTGTVVTGTVWSGTLPRDGSVRILPGVRVARVRGIESHAVQQPAAQPGTRAAIALGGVEVSDLGRGSVLVADPTWVATQVLLADVALLPDAPRPLGPRTQVRFHLGTLDVGARVVATGGALAPGGRSPARVLLDEPVVARGGDRFVIRGSSPLVTIGGGVVGDPSPHRRRAKPWVGGATTSRERLLELLRTAGGEGIPTATLPVRVGVTPAEVPALLSAAGPAAIERGDRVYDAASVSEARKEILAAVDAHLRRHPLEPGAPLQSVRDGIGAGEPLVAELMRELVDDGSLEVAGALVRRAGWASSLTPTQRRVRDALAAELEAAGREPPDVAELAVRHGPDTLPLLRNLERDGLVVQVSGERYYARAPLEELIGVLRSAMRNGREFAPAELRDLVGGSRKYVIPLLEYCDRVGITERRASGRVLAMAHRRALDDSARA